MFLLILSRPCFSLPSLLYSIFLLRMHISVIFLFPLSIFFYICFSINIFLWECCVVPVSGVLGWCAGSVRILHLSASYRILCAQVQNPHGPISRHVASTTITVDWAAAVKNRCGGGSVRRRKFRRRKDPGVESCDGGLLWRLIAPAANSSSS